MSLSVLINANAGTVEKKGIATVRKEIEDQLDGELKSIDFAPPDELQARLLELRDERGDILIGGGDGTISFAARLLCAHNKPFGVIPLGTMNLFANDLGISSNLSEALAQYRHYETKFIDYGRVNSQIFICNAILGVVPGAAKVREEARHFKELFPWPNILAATMQGLSKNRRKLIELRWGEAHETRLANAVIVAHNCYCKAPGPARNRLRKESMTCGRLSVYLAEPKSPFATVRLLARILKGTWLCDPAIESFETDELDVNLKRQSVFITIDGEVENMALPLHFKIERQAMPVLVPTKPIAQM